MTTPKTKVYLARTAYGILILVALAFVCAWASVGSSQAWWLIFIEFIGVIVGIGLFFLAAVGLGKLLQILHKWAFHVDPETGKYKESHE